MRTYTLLFSIVVHMTAVAAVIVAPLFANDVLPDPLGVRRLVLITPAEPPLPPPPVARRSAPPPPESTSAAPIEVPTEVLPEPATEPVAPTPGIFFGVPDGTQGAVPLDGVVVAPQPLPPPPPRAPVRVGGIVRPPEKIVHVAPRYPPIAVASRVTGTVILDAVIDETGTVRDVRVLRSFPLLDQAAIDAVRQWRYTPTLLNGEPVQVVMSVTVRFSLD